MKKYLVFATIFVLFMASVLQAEGLGNHQKIIEKIREMKRDFLKPIFLTEIEQQETGILVVETTFSQRDPQKGSSEMILTRVQFMHRLSPGNYKKIKKGEVVFLSYAKNPVFELRFFRLEKTDDPGKSEGIYTFYNTGALRNFYKNDLSDPPLSIYRLRNDHQEKVFEKVLCALTVLEAKVKHEVAEYLKIR